LYEKHSLAAKGSTGNTTHPSVYLGSSYEAVVLQFVVEAAGATPTVTWKVQATADEPWTSARLPRAEHTQLTG
jgi:hypothetical protein